MPQWLLLRIHKDSIPALYNEVESIKGKLDRFMNGIEAARANRLPVERCKCGGKSSVLDTRVTLGGMSRWRRRGCDTCGETWTTREIRE